MNAWRVKGPIVAVAAIGVVLLDQLSKHLVVGRIREGRLHPVIDGFFELTLRYNKGAAFSLFDSSPILFFLAVSALAIAALIYFLSQLDDGQRVQIAALGTVLGGALGNLWDRVTVGGVVDFLLFHVKSFAWPAFNVADMAIVVGVAVFLLDNMRARPAGAGSEG